MYGRAPRQDNGYGARAAQGAQRSPQGYGGGPPTGPRHAGLGSVGAPSSLPGRPSNLPPTPMGAAAPPGTSPPVDGGAAGALGMQAAAQGERFSLFVGTIVDGLENAWLERILGVAGPVLSFRRPAPSMAFVEFGDAESVLRALEVVHGANIKTKAGAEKALLVKADEKTRGRLDEYEKERVKAENTDDLTEQAKGDLANILTRIANGDPVTAHDDDPNADPADRKPRIPQHLKDLAPEDLPESHRDSTLSSIASFRQAAQKKAQAKHDLDRQIEERRQAAIAESVRLQHQPARHGPAGSPPLAASPAPSSATAAAQDPQSFNRPVAFVAGTSSGATAPLKPLSELDDARQERDRAEREYRQAEGVFRARERQFEARERARIAAWEREQARERGAAEQEERDRAYMADRLARWDDEHEAERGREAFYTDRLRWRAQRRPIRLREQEADERDRALEAQQLAALEAQSESFLAQHVDLLASSLPTPVTAGEPGTGGSSTPLAVKLNFSAAAPKPSAAEAPKPRPTAVTLLEDDDESQRKKRALIPLEYSDDEGEDRPRLSRGEAERKASEIEARVPADKEGLWAWKVRWKRLSEDMVKDKIAPFANKAIVGYLGAEEPELLNVVREYLRDHKAAQELLDELEPVLDEDATDFVVKVWRRLALETEFAHAGVVL
ncbi:uncharacterized protein RHOBADRAFT_52433 [Rhodotorula graminis WP1]|uniref:PWI domain-containing protein n=1 Tax=Rhodotorula graminis (strain WP1) TaxID=578459 RepID=A0A194S757_RHOGW|nr:uncharacterized protein RHOBADRAFT_52433 [Rhodotorula graminis WP1]KPV76422.1 hypothetical protein RHOBADRAFT_52433 [Rhodotorula graminis WP1]